MIERLRKFFSSFRKEPRFYVLSDTDAGNPECFVASVMDTQHPDADEPYPIAE